MGTYLGANMRLIVYIRRRGRQYSTNDHTHWRILDPVRSPPVKPVRAGLVVGSVTTSEHPVLFVFFFFFYF